MSGQGDADGPKCAKLDGDSDHFDERRIGILSGIGVPCRHYGYYVHDRQIELLYNDHVDTSRRCPGIYERHTGNRLRQRQSFRQKLLRNVLFNPDHHLHDGSAFLQNDRRR